MTDLDWHRPLQSRAGYPARLRKVDGWQKATGDTRRRVQTCRYKFPRGKKNWDSATVWLCDEGGATRRDNVATDHDIINFGEMA